MRRERSIQQLDPLGALAARPFTVFGAVGIAAVALTVTLIGHGDVESGWIATAALGALAAASGALVYASSPVRAPLRRNAHLLVVGLAVLALALNSLSLGATNHSIGNDWGPAAVGALFLLLAPYRPPRELVAVAAFAALFGGFSALVQTPAVEEANSPVVNAVLAMAPILAMAIGGAVFISALVRGLERWRGSEMLTATALATEHAHGIALSVQQDRVAILNRDVVPFFAQVLTRSSLRQSDRARAAELSDSIRRVMVAEIDRSWLDSVLSQAAAERGIAALPAVDDPLRLAPAMGTHHRTALRALLVALLELDGFIPAGFSLGIRRVGATCAVTLRAELQVSEAVSRAALGPLLAVLRVVFTDLQATFGPSTITLRFYYDQR